MKIEKEKSYLEIMVKKLTDELNARGFSHKEKENSTESEGDTPQLKNELRLQNAIAEELLFKNQVWMQMRIIHKFF